MRSPLFSVTSPSTFFTDNHEAESWPRTSHQCQDLALQALGYFLIHFLPDFLKRSSCQSLLLSCNLLESRITFSSFLSLVACVTNDLHSQLVSDRLSNLPEITQHSSTELYFTLNQTPNSSPRWIIQEHSLNELTNPNSSNPFQL